MKELCNRRLSEICNEESPIEEDLSMFSVEDASTDPEDRNCNSDTSFVDIGENLCLMTVEEQENEELEVEGPHEWIGHRGPTSEKWRRKN